MTTPQLVSQCFQWLRVDETTRQIFIYTVIMVLGTLAAAILPFFRAGPFYLGFSILAGGWFLWWAWKLWRQRPIGNSMALFHYSILYIGLVFTGVMLDAVLFRQGGVRMSDTNTPEQAAAIDPAASNRRLGAILMAVVGLMFLFAPVLYVTGDLLCDALGIGVNPGGEGPNAAIGAEEAVEFTDESQVGPNGERIVRTVFAATTDRGLEGRGDLSCQ